MKPWRYFNDQGVEVTSTSDAIYHVHTRVLPSSHLPATSSSNSNSSLATITVQVVTNPSNRPIKLRPASETDPLAQTVDPAPGLVFYTYNSHVARVR
ncbi:hypothetical protein [Verrucomicrobium spinosum]|uniref:hypothetical protein n=1 Tax=Verrucomicrobium spinosum TaxID=2736 RepID=UPI0009465DFA|nr:hypothetical protein [Verrucomicrobium spinosum]